MILMCVYVCDRMSKTGDYEIWYAIVIEYYVIKF